jgi:hypothetical protein
VAAAGLEEGAEMPDPCELPVGPVEVGAEPVVVPLDELVVVPAAEETDEAARPGKDWLRYTPATATAATEPKAMPLVIVRPRAIPASR